MLGRRSKMLLQEVSLGVRDVCLTNVSDLGNLLDLDTVKVDQTFKHPCLFTLTVDAFRSQGGSAAPSPQQDMSQWHLPTPDPRGDGKYMYRIHTVDIYFWTPEDATLFLDSLKRVSQAHQLQLVPNPSATPAHSEHKNDVMNPVVARLENAAISHSSRSPSISGSQSFPGPPTAPAPTSSPPAGEYTPMAYNPAAPAAPEPIAHREKTPPPPDAADGTGLGAAAMHDQPPQGPYNPLQASFTPQSTSGPYTPGLPGPPSRAQTFSGPPTPGIQRTGSGSLPPPPQSPPAFGGPPAQQYANYPGSTSQAPVQSPGYPAHSPLPSPGFPPQQQYQPLSSPPPGGFTQYQYGSTTASNPSAIHQQLYRPTEQEASVDGNEVAPQRNSNMGRRAEKVEKGVGKFLKKLDKKF